MTREEVLKKCSYEMRSKMVAMPGSSADLEFYLNMVYVAGYEAGSRSRSRQIAVIQMDKYGNHIKRFESIAQAARSTRVDNSSIIDVCKSKAHSAGGFLWKYESA